MFEAGDVVHHNGEQGRFVVKKIREDGDVGCFGGSGYVPGEKNIKCHAAFRTFRPNECCIAKTKRKLRVEYDG